MDTTLKSTSRSHLAKELPSYSFKIRELRKTVGLSQPQLAAELSKKRGAVARWETGTREPRAENFAALAKFSKKHKLPEFAQFFSQHIEERKSDRKKEAEEAAKEADALRYLETVESQAAAGNIRAKRLLELSRRDGKEFAKEQAGRIEDARWRLENGAFSAFIYEIADETQRVGRLHGGRQVRVSRALANLRRRYEQAEPFDVTHAEAKRAQKQEIVKILHEAEADHGAGKSLNWVELGRKVDETYRPVKTFFKAQQKMLDRMTAVSRIMSKVKDAQEKGAPVDELEFIDQIERALEIGRGPKKSKG
jgi:transcriptional regulator with XRE-family HTH domain